MAYIQSNDVRVSIGEKLIGGQQSCSMSKESSTTETTTKDSGMWADAEVNGLSWAVDCDGLIVVDDEALETLNEAWRTGAKVTIKYGSAERYETGQAIIESIEQNDEAKEKSTYSVSFVGCGELTSNK